MPTCSFLLLLVALLFCCLLLHASSTFIAALTTRTVLVSSQNTVIGANEQISDTLAVSGEVCEGCSVTFGPNLVVSQRITIRLFLSPGSLVNFSFVSANGGVTFVKPTSAGCMTPVMNGLDDVRILVRDSSFTGYHDSVMISGEANAFSLTSFTFCGLRTPHLRLDVARCSFDTNCKSSMCSDSTTSSIGIGTAVLAPFHLVLRNSTLVTKQTNPGTSPIVKYTDLHGLSVRAYNPRTIRVYDASFDSNSQFLGPDKVGSIRIQPDGKSLDSNPPMHILEEPLDVIVVRCNMSTISNSEATGLSSWFNTDSLVVMATSYSRVWVIGCTMFQKHGAAAYYDSGGAKFYLNNGTTRTLGTNTTLWPESWELMPELIFHQSLRDGYQRDFVGEILSVEVPGNDPVIVGGTTTTTSANSNLIASTTTITTTTTIAPSSNSTNNSSHRAPPPFHERIPVTPIMFYNNRVSHVNRKSYNSGNLWEFTSLVGPTLDISIANCTMILNNSIPVSSAFQLMEMTGGGRFYFKNIFVRFFHVQEHTMLRLDGAKIDVMYMEMNNITFLRYDSPQTNTFLINATFPSIAATEIWISNARSWETGGYLMSVAIAYCTTKFVRRLSMVNLTVNGTAPNPSSGIFFGIPVGYTANVDILVQGCRIEVGSSLFTAGIGFLRGPEIEGAHGIQIDVPHSGAAAHIKRVLVRNNYYDMTRTLSLLTRCNYGFAYATVDRMYIMNEESAKGAPAFCAFPGRPGSVDYLSFRRPCSTFDGNTVSSKSDAMAVLKSSGGGPLKYRLVDVQPCTVTRSWLPPIITDSRSLSQETPSLSQSLVQTDSLTYKAPRTATYMPPEPNAALDKQSEDTQSATSILTVTSLLSGAGSSAGLDNGRALAALSVVSRCASYEKSKKEAVNPKLVDAKFADSYLNNKIPFPESPLPICMGQTRGACLRGAVLANFLVLIILLIVGAVIGYVKKWALTRRSKGALDSFLLDAEDEQLMQHMGEKQNSNESNRSDHRPNADPLLGDDAMMLNSPRTASGPVSPRSPPEGTTPRTPRGGNGNLSREGSGGSFSRRGSFSGGAGAGLTSPFGSGNNLKRTSSGSLPATSSSSSSKQRQLQKQQQQQEQQKKAAALAKKAKDEVKKKHLQEQISVVNSWAWYNFGRIPLLIGQACAFLLASWAQIVGVLIAAPDLPAGDQMVWGVGSILLWIVLSVVFFRVMARHLQSPDDADSATDEKGGRNFTNRGGIERSGGDEDDGVNRDWRMEEAFINFGDNDPKFPKWRSKLGAFLRTSLGRSLFIGNFVWTEGNSRGAVANGRPGTMLWQCGSLINKARGPYVVERPFEERTTPHGKSLAQGKRNNRAFGGAMVSRRYVINDWMTRVAPYYFFVNVFLTALSGLLSGISIAVPAACNGIKLTLDVIAVASVVFTVVLRPHLVPARNCASGLADLLLTIGLILAQVGESDVAVSIIVAATVCSVCSGMLSGIKNLLLRISRGAICLREEMWKELSASLAVFFGGTAAAGAEFSSAQALLGLAG